jgi:hypothetical protein
MQLDAELRERLSEVHCPRCQTTGGYALIGLDYPHFGRVVCAATAAPLIEAIPEPMRDEGHFVDWLQKPRENGPRRRRTRMRKVESLSERCEICLRHSSELSAPVKLEAHHAHEARHDGSDDEENRRVYCMDCHALVHWARRTLGREHAQLAGEWPKSKTLF